MSESLTYFDPETDTDLLPGDLRSATNLALYADEAERDVIAYYTKPVCETQWLGSTARPVTGWFLPGEPGFGVFLWGYAVLPAEADEELLMAMKRTIARVIRWRLNQDTHDPLTTSESKVGSTSKTYRADHDAPLPKHWDRDLRRFDTRIPPWGL